MPVWFVGFICGIVLGFLVGVLVCSVLIDIDE